MVGINKCNSSWCSSNPFYDPSMGFLVGAYMDSTSEFSTYFVSLQLDNKRQEGDYLFDTMRNDVNSAEIRCGIRVSKFFEAKFSIKSSDTSTYYHGRLHISKWVKGQSGFVSGTFWFDLYNPAQYPDTVRVREGRFDIPFQ